MSTLNLHINVNQPRIATGADTSAQSIFYIYEYCDGIHIADERSSEENEYYFDEIGKYHGTATIHHPYIMAGTPEEIRSDVFKIIKNDLVKSNKFFESENGNIYSV